LTLHNKKREVNIMSSHFGLGTTDYNKARERAIAFFACAEKPLVSVALVQGRNKGEWVLFYRVKDN
jgi:hypothetical protein